MADTKTLNRKRAASMTPANISPSSKYRKRSNTEESRDENRSGDVVVPGELHKLPVIVRFIPKRHGNGKGKQLNLGLGCLNSIQKLTGLVKLCTCKKEADMLGTYDVAVKYGDPNKSYSDHFTLSELASKWKKELKRIFTTLVALQQPFMWLHVELYDNLDVCFNPDPAEVVKIEQILGIQSNETHVQNKKHAEFGEFFLKETYNGSNEDVFGSGGTKHHRTPMKSIKESKDMDPFVDNRISVGESDGENSVDYGEAEINEINESVNDNTTGGSIATPWTDISVGHGPTQLIEPPLSPTPKRPRATAHGPHNHRSPFFQDYEKKHGKRACAKRKPEKGAETRRATMKPSSKNLGEFA